jgi:ABC-type enterobactin transport system permease subunit
MDTTDIEKKSLEAHVELCAERYRMLELKIQNVESDVGSVKTMVTEVHDMMQKMAAKQTDRLISWGIGIIGFLVGTVGWLISQYILK